MMSFSKMTYHSVFLSPNPVWTFVILLSMAFVFPESHGSPYSYIPPDITSPDSLHTDTVTASVTSLNFKEKVKRTGNFLYRFIKNFDDYDTDYITPNYYNYTAMLQNTNFYQLYQLRATSADGQTQTLKLSPSPTLKIGPYFGWRWIFLGYTFDVSHLRKAVKTTEFNLSLYSSMLGCDLVYIRNTGDFTIKRVTGFDETVSQAVTGRNFSGLDAYTASLNAYYVFNHRHFSFPAAFAQSTVQRKSCGSWILGVSYAHQKVKFDYRRLPYELVGTGDDGPLIDELKVNNINYRTYNINGGYAYNWAFAPNFLFSVSLTPQIGFKQAKGEKLSGESLWFSVRNFKFDFITRTGLVWNNSRWFAGASFISHILAYNKEAFSMTNMVNYLNIYAGFSFHRKRQYRNK